MTAFPFDDPLDGWEAQYYRLIGHHTVLQIKAADGMFDPDEWRGLIAEMKAAGHWALAEEVRKEYIREEDGNDIAD